MAPSSQRWASAGATNRLLGTFAMLASMLSIAYIAGMISTKGFDESSRSLLETAKRQPNEDFSHETTKRIGTMTPVPSRSASRFIEVVVDDELKVTDSSSDFDSQLDLDDQFFSD